MQELFEWELLRNVGCFLYAFDGIKKAPTACLQYHLIGQILHYEQDLTQGQF